MSAGGRRGLILVLAVWLGVGLCSAAFAAVSVAAAKPSVDKEKVLGAFGAWRAYAYEEGGQKVCYMVTMKTLRSIGPKKRAAPYLMITHRPVEASTDVVSYGAGTPLDQQVGVRLRVGAAVFDLFSVRDTAWARDSRTDHKLAGVLKSSESVQASAAWAKKVGVAINDVFDLTGAGDAYQAIGKACGLVSESPVKTPAKPMVAQVKKKTALHHHKKKHKVHKKVGKSSDGRKH